MFRNMASKVVRALDPVKGAMVSSLDISRCSHEDALNYITKYNTFLSGKKNSNQNPNTTGGEGQVDFE